MCGDLNSRTANCSHYDPEDNNVSDLLYSSQPVSIDRCSQDSVLNNYGKLLMNMCTAINLSILNGMCHGERNGRYTFISESGCSVNDYVLMSCELFSLLCDVCELNVIERADSDHLPVSFSINNSGVKHRDTVIMEGKTIEKFVWKDSLADIFHKNLSTKNFEDKLTFVDGLIDTDIDNALDAFNACIREAADCMKIEVNCNKKRSPQEWYDAECHIAKREVRRSLRKFRRTLENNDRDNYCKKRREYKHLLMRKRKQFYDDLLNDLLSSVHSQKIFWDTINRVSNKRRQPTNNISSDTWFKHFKDLLTKETQTVPSVQRNDDKEEINNLNRPISKEEVLLAIRRIKK